MSGPIPAGSPSVSAKTRGKGRATARYLTSIMALLRRILRKRLDFAWNCSANISSRTSFLAAPSSRFSFLAHSANISIPCAVTSGLVRCSRSEEHTSELQSHLNLVCRLLLEKKKKKKIKNFLSKKKKKKT